MASTQGQKPHLDRYVVIHVATTCDEHGVYVTKDSAEVIELGWILLDAKSCEEVTHAQNVSLVHNAHAPLSRFTERASLSNPSTLPLLPYVVSIISNQHFYT